MAPRRLFTALTCLATCLAVSAPGPAGAADRAVDLELVLAVDISGSIDPDEATLQRAGYVSAFRSPELIAAVEGGLLGRLAVVYMEWAGHGTHEVLVDWTEFAGAREAHAFADALAAMPVLTARRTSISEAIDYAVTLFDANGFEGTRRVIDVSGDGPNNYGRLVVDARDDALARGLTINGLPIVAERASRWGWPPMPNLDLFYRDCVIGGPGAFLVAVRDYDHFGDAIRKKLVLEIAGRAPVPRARLWRVAEVREAPPCDIGELMWRRLVEDW